MSIREQWSIETKYIERWVASLDEKSRADVYAALELLAREGPALKRPLVGKVVGSRYKNMKELRPGSSKKSTIRILFIFDPRQQAVLLLAGDKAGGNNKWNRWYNKNIPIADEIYQQHLQSLSLQHERTR